MYSAALTGYGHNSENAQFPLFSLTASGSRLVQGGEMDMPAFSLEGYSGGAGEFTLDMSATIAGTSDPIGRSVNLSIDIRLPYYSHITFPKFSLTGSGITEGSATGAAKFPKFSLAGYGAGNALLRWPLVSLTGSANVEEAGNLVDQYPCDFVTLFNIRWSLTASGTAHDSGQATVSMPEFSLETTNLEPLAIPLFWVDGRAA